MKKTRGFASGLFLIVLLAGCATTTTAPQQPYQESLVTTYEQFGQALEALEPILLSMETNQILKGNNLAVAKATYAQVRSVYFQAGIALKAYIAGSGTPETYQKLIQQVVALLNQVSALVPQKVAGNGLIPEENLFLQKIQCAAEKVELLTKIGIEQIRLGRGQERWTP